MVPGGSTGEPAEGFLGSSTGVTRRIRESCELSSYLQGSKFMTSFVNLNLDPPHTSRNLK